MITMNKHITWSYILICLTIFFENAVGDENLALRKHASQSSNFSDDNPPNYAVDGDKTTFLDSRGGPNQWWMVDLGDSFLINRVVIYNRNDPRYQYRLQKIYILTSDTGSVHPSLSTSVWRRIFYQDEELGESKTFNFVNESSRFLAVFSKYHEAINLAEFEAYEAGQNLALRKTASQSTTYLDLYSANKAVDGNRTTYSHTQGGPDQWWMVDLGASHVIDRIVIYNRNETNFQFRLQKITILISLTGLVNPSLKAAEWKRIWHQEAQLGAKKTVNLPPVLGRFLAVFSEHLEPINIAEFEAYGKPRLSRSLSTQTNQSSTFDDEHDSNIAIDGSEQMCFSKTQAQSNQWWMVTLERAVYLSCTVIYAVNPTTCSYCKCVDSFINLAVEKNASQSSTYLRSYPSYAVNGDESVNGNLSKTNAYANQWWRVDLGNLAMVNRIVLHMGRDQRNTPLQKISVLFSVSPSDDPSPNSPEWKEVLNFNKTGLDDYFNRPIANIATRHISVFSGSDHGVVLREVEVYGFVLQPPLVVLIASEVTSQVPTLSPGAWRSFGVRENHPSKSFSLCAQNDFILVQQLAVLNNYDSTGVALSEVFIYEITPPVLDEQDPFSTSVTFDAIQFSLRSWNKNMLGDIAPEGYVISWSNSQNTGSTEHLHVDGDNLVVNASSLIPGTTYRFRVTCLARGMTRNVSDKSNRLSFSTLACGEPSIPIVDIKPATEPSGLRKNVKLIVSWQEPSINCTRIKPYKVSLSKAKQLVAIVNSTSLQNTFENVDAYTEYTVVVTFENNMGLTSQANQTITTPEIEPYDSPTQFSIIAVNTSCIDLRWQEPERPNGAIKTYEYNCSNDDHQSVAEAETKCALVCYLRSAAKVTCQVRAKNYVGFGPYTQPTSVYTPVQVKYFPDLCGERCRDVLDGKLELNIQSVQLENPDVTILSYVIIMRRESSYMNRARRYTQVIDPGKLCNVTEAASRNLSYYVTAELNSSYASNGTSFTVGDGRMYGGYYNAPLEEGEMYSVWNGIRVQLDRDIIVVNSYGSIPFQVIRNIAPLPLFSGSLPITLGPLFGGFAIIAVAAGVVIFLLRRRKNMRRQTYTTQHLNLQMNETRNEAGTDPPGNRRLACSPASGASAGNDAYEEMDLVNSGKVHQPDVPCSGSLSGHHAYEALDFVNHSKVHQINVPSSRSSARHHGYARLDLVSTAKVYRPDVPSSDSLARHDAYEEIDLVNSANACQPDVASSIKERRSGSKETTLSFHNKTVKCAETSTVSPMRSTPPVPTSKPTDKVYENSEALRESQLIPVDTKEWYTQNSQPPCDSEPIPVDKMEWYMQNSQDLIDLQFTKLEQLPMGEMTVAVLPENTGKNSYIGIYPVDQHRVILQRKQSEGTDYINASHLQGYHKKSTFIAAQGPTEATTTDFWLMIWQQNPSAIVMVANITEEGKLKCSQYWSEEGSPEVVFGDISVGSCSVEKWADFTVRTLKVTKQGTVRTLELFQYTSWADHTVPKEITPFLLFYRKVQSSISSHCGPLLVHCSAGVGRTGTFISLAYLLEQAAAKEVVDPFQCVKQFWERRPYLVQTKEQYVFLHMILVEALVTKQFRAAPSELDKRLQAFEVNDTRMNTIEREFEQIEKRVKACDSEFETAKLEVNRTKNRHKEILPCERHRVVLHSSAGDYINAVFLDSVREKDHMIATQLPLNNTVADFWQMVVQYDCRSIIQMQLSEVLYFPSEADSAMHVADIQLHCCHVQVAEFFTTRRIVITTKADKKEIQLFAINSANSYTCPSPESLLSLFGEVELLQQQTGSHRVLIACQNGATRCGDFICCSNALSKFKLDQVVDVYNSVLVARLRRPRFIYSLEQYVNIYRLLKLYRDSLSTYTGFQ